MRLAGTRTLNTGSRADANWCTSLRARTPASNVPSSCFSISTNAVPLMRSSAEATAAATKSAWPMPVMNRPRLSICSTGSLPGFHSAMRILPSRTTVSTPTCGRGSVSTNAPCHGSRGSPSRPGATRPM